MSKYDQILAEGLSLMAAISELSDLIAQTPQHASEADKESTKVRYYALDKAKRNWATQVSLWKVSPETVDGKTCEECFSALRAAETKVSHETVALMELFRVKVLLPQTQRAVQHNEDPRLAIYVATQLNRL